MKNRKRNFNGPIPFYSFVPTRISNFEIPVMDEDLEELHSLAEKLNNLSCERPKEFIEKIISEEADDSWRIANDKPFNPFMFSFGQNENAKNIVRAILYGEEALKELPISVRLTKNLHYIICESSDYDKIYRGEIRVSPIWVGSPGKTLTDAEYIAPTDDDLINGLTDLDFYINCSEDNPFIKASIIHYQIEMLHPFIDGNGRLGRLLVILFLFESGILKYPALILSKYIGQTYIEYCNTIQYVHETGDISIWIKYFIRVLKVAIEDTIFSIGVKKIDKM